MNVCINLIHVAEKSPLIHSLIISKLRGDHYLHVHVDQRDLYYWSKFSSCQTLVNVEMFSFIIMNFLKFLLECLHVLVHF